MTTCTTPRCENPGRWQVTETGARVCAEHLPMGKPAFLAEPATPSPPAEPPADAVRVVVRGTLVEFGRHCASVRFNDGGSEWLPNDDVSVISSLLPAGWPRDQLGAAKGPLLKLRPHMNSNECRRALSEAFGRIPEPTGGWKGRDAVIVETIRGLCAMFAPFDNPGSSGWWEIQDALAAVAQLADEVEVGL